ncbi:hypothetical protein AB0H00_30450 [Nocardia sp. NPDC023852]
MARPRVSTTAAGGRRGFFANGAAVPCLLQGRFTPTDSEARR